MCKSPLAALALCALLAACATAAPPADKRALAAEVFALSGGLEDVRFAARFAGPALAGRLGGAGINCRDRLGAEASGLEKAACEMAEAAIGLARGSGDEIGKALDAQLAGLEARAAEAMADTYSTAELQAMRRYYASPEGRAIVAKRADYWARLMEGKSAAQ